MIGQPFEIVFSFMHSKVKYVQYLLCIYKYTVSCWIWLVCKYDATCIFYVYMYINITINSKVRYDVIYCELCTSWLLHVNIIGWEQYTQTMMPCQTTPDRSKGRTFCEYSTLSFSQLFLVLTQNEGCQPCWSTYPLT